MRKTPPKTLHGKIVFYKKKIFVKRWIPETIARPIDNFLNNLVTAKEVTRDNVIRSMELTRDSFIKTKDITRDSFIKTKDLTRDTLVKSRDITKDNLIQSKDITRDSFIKTKDLTRDNFIQSKDITRDSFIKTKDLTRDNFIQSKDITRDSFIKTKDITRDNFIQSKDITRDSILKTKEISTKEREDVKNKIYFASKSLRFYYIKFLFTFAYSFIVLLITVISKRKYTITEKSDKNAVKELDSIIANSTNIKNKIVSTYNRDATVVYPPVDVGKIMSAGGSRSNGGYWLSVSRLEPYKRIEMQLKAFGLSPDERLIIIGGGDSHNKNYENRLSVMAPYNVTFVGSVTEDELVEYYLAAKGLITTTKNEDFGMTAVEAMAAGKPVIAPNDGGYKETIDADTGILLDEIDEFKIAKSIQKINGKLAQNEHYYVDNCVKNAQKYAREHFITNIRNTITT